MKFLASQDQLMPIKILKGPRQVGKTSLLDQLGTHRLISLDDLNTRTRAEENPRLFLDQFDEPILLDEATLAPNLFPELKRRVDEFKRNQLRGKKSKAVDVWITGSNQTLLHKNVQETLAGRATYFDLNTISIHEMENLNLQEQMLRGGWPELRSNREINAITYLNDFISTYIERDIVSAAGIERRAAFGQSLGLLAGRVGQLVNYSDIAKNVGVDVTTIQSWVSHMQQNALLKIVPPYFSNINQRLIKTPKIYFEDVGLASRLQGWSEYMPLLNSPSFGNLLENLAGSEIFRFFGNNHLNLEIYFLRSKEKVEIDFLLKLPNQRWLAIEVKSKPVDFTQKQLALLDSVQLNVIERWVVTPQEDDYTFTNSRVVSMSSIFENLNLLTR